MRIVKKRRGGNKRQRDRWGRKRRRWRMTFRAYESTNDNKRRAKSINTTMGCEKRRRKRGGGDEGLS